MIVGLGCLGIVVLLVLLGAVIGSDDKSSSANKVEPTATAAEDEKTGDAAEAEEEKTEEAEAKDDTEKDTEKDVRKDAKKDAKKNVVTFKVWGTAPAGVLGPLDITYGSDSDTRQGKWKNGKFTATLPLDDDALYFTVMAQLQGEGDINCSVTVEGHTEKAHAAGGYNICHAQANAGLLGGWD
ncbi:hypothetical protein [Streptomyces caniscabiei]|uniref:hypothetical protein n=1 Tax=Streptomyces caniscabiei TaxID=2746961 RepID=UPI000A85B34C|nr:hypothetical protein [Streptomyces caniscabiei]